MRKYDDKIHELNEEIDAVKELMVKTTNELRDAIFPKAESNALNDLEAKVLTKLNEIVEILYKKFADKSDTKQNFKILERQIKNLFELIMNSKKDPAADEDDALLARKHLGGFSCASCEKNLTNMSGTKVEYNTWGRLPYRDPADRLTRIGQGFSKMLTRVRSGSPSNKEMNKTQHNEKPPIKDHIASSKSSRLRVMHKTMSP